MLLSLIQWLFWAEMVSVVLLSMFSSVCLTWSLATEAPLPVQWYKILKGFDLTEQMRTH